MSLHIDEKGIEGLKKWVKEIEELAEQQEEEAREKMRSAAAWRFIAKAVKAQLGK